jgi:hypothetical protein
MPYDSVDRDFVLLSCNSMACFFCQEEKEFFEDVSEEELDTGFGWEWLGLLGYVDGVPELSIRDAKVTESQGRLSSTLTCSICDMLAKSKSEGTNVLQVRLPVVLTE